MVITAAALVMSACGGGGGGGDKADASKGDPVEGGSVSLIQMSEPRILDPAVMGNSFTTSAIVGNSLFGTLLSDKPDGTFDYGLAKSLETSDGGTTWKLTLRDGITYSDGSPMDAEDVAYNWERIKQPELGSQTATVANYLRDLRPDGQVLTFTLTEPIANFGHAITYFTLNWIAKPEALEAGQAEFDKAPIGAGPFRLKSWTRGGKMVLTKNPEYYDDPRPYLDELVLTANGDEPQRYATVQSGGADGAIASDAALYRRGVEDGLKGVPPQGLSGGVMVVMNTRIAPFDDLRAREAVAKAVDLDAVNEATYEGEGTIPKSLFSKDSLFANDTPLTGYDPDEAQSIFDELAGEGKPVEFTISAFQATESRRVCESIQAQLNTYDNVSVKLEVLDFPAATAKTNARKFQMTQGGVGFVDPEVALYEQLHSGARGNITGVADDEMDAALERGRTSSDIDERKAAYAIVAERFSALTPALFNLAWTGPPVVHNPDIAGFGLYGNTSVRVDGVWTTKK